jgi:hypothetical protein
MPSIFFGLHAINYSRARARERQGEGEGRREKACARARERERWGERKDPEVASLASLCIPAAIYRYHVSSEYRNLFVHIHSSCTCSQTTDTAGRPRAPCAPSRMEILEISLYLARIPVSSYLARIPVSSCIKFCPHQPTFFFFMCLTSSSIRDTHPLRWR